MAIGTMWWRLLPWERWMWWRLSTGSDPATKPRASAATHRARWASSARGLAGGETCVLQLPNIFPELLFPDGGEGWGVGGRGSKVELRRREPFRAPWPSPLQTSPRSWAFAQIRKEKKTRRDGKKNGEKSSSHDGGGKNVASLECGRKQPAVF